MAAAECEVLPLRSTVDIVNVRQCVRRLAVEAGFSLVDQTKIITAASEIGRNTVVHGRGGTARLELLNTGDRHGLKITFEDSGPGIPDVAQAMSDGYSTGSGLGLGLGGAKRLVNEFSIETKPGDGTRVVLTRWK